ncbi:MAG TPA: single-stranded DNA-binding protein, partial [Burkholderiaceae bacterium]
RKWQDKEGKDNYTTEIIAEQMQMLGSREGMGGGGGDDHSESRPAAAPRAPSAKPGAKSATGFDDMDDDIPF